MKPQTSLRPKVKTGQTAKLNYCFINFHLPCGKYDTIQGSPIVFLYLPCFTKGTRKHYILMFFSFLIQLS